MVNVSNNLLVVSGVVALEGAVGGCCIIAFGARDITKQDNFMIY